MMDIELLERRRAINRKAARKSRSRQKEQGLQIRKKYFEAQSANTKLVYERNLLEKERNQLRETFESHQRLCTLPVQAVPSPFGVQTLKHMVRKPSLERSQSVLQDATTSRLSQSGSVHHRQNSGNDIEEIDVSSDDDDVGDGSSSSDGSMASNFSGLGIKEPVFASNSSDIIFNLSEVSQISEDSSFLNQIPELSDIYGYQSIEFPFLEELNETSTHIEDQPLPMNESSLESGVGLPDQTVFLQPHNIETMITVTDSLPVSVELCLDSGQQSEALDLSRRGPSSQNRRNLKEGSKSTPSTPSVLTRYPLAKDFSNENAKTEPSTPEPGIAEQSRNEALNFFGNIPILVESFIVGEKY